MILVVCIQANWTFVEFEELELRREFFESSGQCDRIGGHYN
jgi:hypothetical protein